MSIKRIVEETDTLAGRSFNCFFILLVLYSLVCFTFETMPDLTPWWEHFFDVSEIAVTILFTVEYLLRLYVATHKLKFVFSFHGLVDLVALLPYYLGHVLDLRAVRVLRLMQAFRALKLFRYTKALNRLKQAIITIKEELIVYFLAASGLLYLAAVGIYYFERDLQPEKFGSVFACLWWSLITLTTVGYGDVYPQTIGGRIFTGCILWIGIGIISVPSGLMASALTKLDRADERRTDD